MINDSDIPDNSIPDSAEVTVEVSSQHSLGEFYVVALGGSAGSLSALEKFFKNMPADSGIAFVIISHLDVAQESMLPDIMRRWTAMNVTEVQDGLALKPNRIHIMPHTAYMEIHNEKLQLVPRFQEGGKRLPIDLFFQSLAKDVKHRAIGVVLSGMDGDGSIGLKMIIENLGLVIAQEPSSAEFDSMPRSAIATELVDYILPAEEMPEKILAYISNPLPKASRDAVFKEGAGALQKILAAIKTKTGHDFSQYKRNTILRRIERRMQSHQMEFPQYLNYLEDNPFETDFLFKELLIGVTKFFRDAEAFEILKEKMTAYLRNAHIEDNTIRVWVAACSTGEEAYSVAILLLECLATMPHRTFKLQIFATDINAAAIDIARQGIYPHNIEGDVSEERLNKFFTKQEGHKYTIKKEVRELIVFATHNLIKDAPFTKVHLLACRNCLIYFSTELQKKLIPVFSYALQKDAILFLGPSEALTGFSDFFSVADSKWKLFHKVNTSPLIAKVADFPFSFPSATFKTTTPVERKVFSDAVMPGIIQRILVTEYVPPCVIINSKGEVLYINGRTGKYLEPAPGLGLMNNVFSMAREGLKYELSSAVHRALSENTQQIVERINVKTNGHYQQINLRVKPLNDEESLKGLLLVAFEDIPAEEQQKVKRKSKSKMSSGNIEELTELEKELHFTRHRLQITIEELETSLEELKSTNEELQSANEELQSTNEEAMTNKEEMLSLNEELMVINMEYQTKTQELVETNNIIKNLLDSMDIATMFVDNELNIKRYTPYATRLLNLIPTDIGRPLAHISTNLEYTGIVSDIQEVLDNLTRKEVMVESKNGQWYSMRIAPSRTQANYINGVVITFTDMTAIKHYEEKLLKSETLLKEAQRTAHIGHFEYDFKTEKLIWSDELYRIYGYEPGALTPDEDFFFKNTQPEEFAVIKQIIEKSLHTREPFSFERKVKYSNNTERFFHTVGRFLCDNSGKPYSLIGIEQDITDRKKIMTDLQLENDSLKRNE